MNILNKALLSLVLIAGCSHQAPPSVSPPPVITSPEVVITAASPNVAPSAPTPGPIQSVEVKAENCTFTLPNAGEWKELNPPSDEIKALWRNNSKHALIIFAKDEFPGTTEKYALVVMEGVKAAHGAVTSVKQVFINGRHLVLVSSNKGAVLVFTWLIAEEGVGYNLSCGGSADEVAVPSLCKEIAGSFKIN